MIAKQEFSKYERARIIGARGLQISMDAPFLIEFEENTLDTINFDPLKIAERELDSGVLPISVNKPMPGRREEDIEKLKVDTTSLSDAAKEQAEREEEREIAQGGEIIELANSSEESEEIEETPTEGTPTSPELE